MNKLKLNEQGWGDANNALEQEKQEKQKQQQQDPEKQKQQQNQQTRKDKNKKQNFDNVGGLNARAAALKKHVLSMPEFGPEKWSAIGGYANRNVGKTDVISQHAAGNALDWHGAKGNLDPIMKKLADWLVANAAQFYVKNVIYNKMIWNYPKGWHTYEYKKLGGDPHVNHVHVDFGTSSKPTPQKNDQLEIHKQVQRARWDVYKVLTKQPEEYFQNFKSFWASPTTGRTFGSDNEEAAADWLEKSFKSTWDSKFKSWEKTAHPHDIQNMEKLRLVIEWAINLIRKHQTGKYTVNFWNYDNDTKKWIQVRRAYYWNYL